MNRKKQQGKSPSSPKKRRNLHINSLFLVTKEHKSSAKFFSLQKLWTRRKQIHTKLNPFVWFKSILPTPSHLVYSTKGLNALKPCHTKDRNDSEEEENEKKNLKKALSFCENAKGEKKAILRRTTSISFSLIDNLCDHKKWAFDFIFIWPQQWTRGKGVFWWCPLCSGYEQKCPCSCSTWCFSAIVLLLSLETMSNVMKFCSFLWDMMERKFDCINKHENVVIYRLSR